MNLKQYKNEKYTKIKYTKTMQAKIKKVFMFTARNIFIQLE